MPFPPDKIETDYYIIQLELNRILTITLKPCKKIDAGDLTDLSCIARRMAEGKPILKLVDARKSWTLTKEAKKYVKMENKSSATVARAIVVSNRYIAWFMNTFASPDETYFPQKYFTDKYDGYKWLLSMKY